MAQDSTGVVQSQHLTGDTMNTTLPEISNQKGVMEWWGGRHAGHGPIPLLHHSTTPSFQYSII
ncbi:MAG TPA: hypothetical protein ENH12_07105 [Proteobacteria bacterium]|nr:hypothetical protein [Pseudomonadota bacterium]